MGTTEDENTIVSTVIREEEQQQNMPDDNAAVSSYRHTKIVYFVRHAEAEHNVREREAVAEAIAKGQKRISAQESARKRVLQRSPSLVDAPLSKEGAKQATATRRRVSMLLKHSRNMKYRQPEVIFVSPLRRTLQTASLCFGTTAGKTGHSCESNRSHSNNWDSTTCSSSSGFCSIASSTEQQEEPRPPPRFVAIEAMREKRTGMACDERSPVSQLCDEFPHVDFSDLERDDRVEIPRGEDNESVRKRAADFFDNYLPHVQSESLAIVGHKGWLRELRNVLKMRADEKSVELEFDISDWHLKLFGNAELRVAQLEWDDKVDDEGRYRLCSLHSLSLDNAIQLETGQIIHDGSDDDDNSVDQDGEYDNELRFLSVRTV
mmetsp:Transcript_29898/g.45867  ORF Transcript_29898/g.45867 Transcript_29898/m.45867 type:complete len:377 (-) Transcript_29898:165-1295(-)|eukprot:CAMPEP_0195298560 /NCGR_PEP_ID=MMETSP0707-20130614/23731_1 /TAXON_ID=33640 /ORGANISM="Asterionellopsis glacialis, Strain CCMP134" /LENGTH=376 /DNA_ID=CAMNT_0040360711 /DNA_START=219 /DNA_END=1349 /DNA_ORIENTATION=-